MLTQLGRLAIWQTADKPAKDWKEIANRKKAERESRLPEEWLIKTDDLPDKSVLDVTLLCAQHKWLNEEELAITGLSAVMLATAIKEKRYTAVEVMKAYAHRATIAQQLVNPLSEVNFEQAIKEAEKLDEHLRLTGAVVGPMHGVPISVKDQFRVKGLDTTVGYCAWADNVAESDSILVACLKKAGAIVLTKTNVAQALWMNESINLVFGRTLNPFNRTLTAGGSSGGEAALLAMRGSAIGIGTDFGGSVRVPSTNCGLYGLRPSWGRTSLGNAAEVAAGLETRRATAGPMGHSPEDINLLMSSYMATKPWDLDQNVLHIPWRSASEVMPSGPLCFAIAYGDEDVTPHPPIMRGLKSTAKLLKQAGHIVVEWQGPLRTGELGDLGWQLTESGGKDDILNSVKATQEPIYPAIANSFELYKKSTTKSQTPYEIWQLQLKKQSLVNWFHDTWQATHEYSGTGRPIDGLITPANVAVAIPHTIDIGHHAERASYGFANSAAILDVTSAAFPTGLRQDPMIDLPDESFKPRSDEDQRLQNLYGEPEKWRGAPIGLQIIGQRLEEEKVIGMLGVIRDAMSKGATT